MTTHKRNQSRGSFSLFSLNTIRSLSRAGSRQAARVPSKDELLERTESSLSYRCDPYNQPPPSPSPQATTVQSYEKASLDHHGHHGLLARDSVSTTLASHARSARHKVSQRLRPLSWFSLQRSSAQDPSYPRSVSAQLPKASSTSTVGRSIISAPTLTSTTNVKVAQAEGVDCGEISDAAFSESTWDSQVGWLPQASAEKSCPSGHDHSSETLHPHQNYGSLDTRRFKSGRVFKLGNALRTRLKGSKGSPLGGRKESPLLMPHPPNLVGKSATQSTFPDRPDAQPRAEPCNHYLLKEKGFGWSSHIRRKSVNHNSGLGDTQNDPPLLSGLNDGDMARTNSVQEDGDSAFGSLTRSFASAVDKLDFQTPPREMSFLKSKSSFFNMKKGTTDNDGYQESKKPEIGISKTSPPARTSSLQRPQISNTLEAPVMTKSRRANLPPTKILATRKVAPEPMIYSTTRNAYIPSNPVAGYPRGVHPLRMHPPDTKPMSIMKQPRVETPSQESVDGSGSISLEDAPIYSPSLGDLSQYARDTPPSIKHTRPEQRKAVVIDTTPTRVLMKEKRPGSTLGGSLRKSSSALSLFSKSRSGRSTGKGAKHDSRASVLPRTNPTALQQRDVNQKMGSHEEKAVRKSPSLHFGGLFKRESSSTLGASTPRDRSIAFQPTTPSPLRNVTRVRRSHSTAQESPPLIAQDA
ncbi:hypothetical protein LTR84_003023 [Exophiala bonariae]|uniref:Uncharacterized protein n=1 Tax=Exophiala bonariae TaxID=1690606 RepID=A0AAV9N7P6_9EURO|nr:hypothetical protein LTR84_003023 [Exophiala bonariae]